MLVHATTVDIAGLGVLILGASGAGKSDLALRLIADGALLVADDQTEVASVSGGLRARSPQRTFGLIEARGVGIIRAAVKTATIVKLVVSLVETEPDRMPEPRTWSLPGESAGGGVPLIELKAFEASAAEKVKWALVAVPIA